MANLVSTTFNKTLLIHVNTNKTDGSTDAGTFTIGDMVDSMRYVENGEIKTISGKVINILMSHEKDPEINLLAGVTDTFASDNKVISITIDTSTALHGEQIVVPANEIIEKSGVTGVKNVRIVPELMVIMTNVYSDGEEKTLDLSVGSVLSGITIVRGKEWESLTDNFTVVTLLYAFKNNDFRITGLVLKGSDDTYISCSIDQIIFTEGGVIIVVEDETAITNAITELPEGETATLSSEASIPITATIKSKEGTELYIDIEELVVPEPVNNRSLYAIDNYGDMTIDRLSVAARGLENFGTMTINDCDITSRDTNGGAGVWNEGDLVINGGNFNVTHVGSTADNAGPGCINTRANGTCKINGGTFTSANKRCYTILSQGHTEINGDIECNGTHGGIAVDSGTAIINKGNFVSTEYYALYVSNDGQGSAGPESARVVVNGGTFTGKTYSVWVGSDVNNPVECTVLIHGGTFNQPVHVQDNVPDGYGIRIDGGKFKTKVDPKFCAEGFVPTEEPDADGWYTVVPA